MNLLKKLINWFKKVKCEDCTYFTTDTKYWGKCFKHNIDVFNNDDCGQGVRRNDK